MNITSILSKAGTYYLAAAMLLISLSCNRTDMKKTSEQPLLSKQQVEEILLEIYVIEGKARVLIYKEHADKVRLLLNYEMKSLFERYNTNYRQFFGSYSYYMADASVSKKMMSDITNRLIVLEAEQIEKNKLVDSLKNNKLIDSLTIK
jgi:hypothetical protein